MPSLRALWTAVLAAFALLLPSLAMAADPSGYWKTIDDETGRPKSVVRIWVDKGVAYGSIVQLYRTPDQDADPLCDDCQGELKTHKIVGMTILTGLKDDGKEWSGGTILDPGNGKTYSCYITVMDGGKKLDVRGYIGFSFIGRTQTWLRVDPPDPTIKTYRLHDDGSITPLVMADGTVVE